MRAGVRLSSPQTSPDLECARQTVDPTGEKYRLSKSCKLLQGPTTANRQLRGNLAQPTNCPEGELLIHLLTRPINYIPYHWQVPLEIRNL